MQLPLEIQFTPQPQREPVAWFLPGDDPLVWLEELLQWDVPQHQLRLYLLPDSAVDRRCRGLLVCGPNPLPPPASRRCQPYGRAGQRLYLPVEARCLPAVTGSELDSLLVDSYVAAVWHPAVGLVGFEAGQEHGLADLLAPPAVRKVAWDRAQSGLAFPRHLRGLVPESPPTMQTILLRSQGDIGTDPIAPPGPEKPGGILPLAAHLGLQALGAAVLKIVDLFPKTATAPTWLDGVAAWANRVLANPGGYDLNSARAREIERLLQMLATDPDRGLRYALPMGGDAHRGIAPPSSQLGPRDVNFNLGNLGGGQASDFWNLPPAIQQQLTQRYRELADRELRLGRHRRAAYIFAQLLSDIPAAANALVSGQHWREAAVLYRDRLARPREAAECLERGGLWTEAIAAYEQIQDFEQVGRLHAFLEQHEEARLAYRKAMAVHLASGKPLEAVRLLCDKLHEPDEALQLLDTYWPRGNFAAACFTRSLELRGSLGHHAAAREGIRRLQDLTTVPIDHPLTLALAEPLATTARDYPDPEVRQIAAETLQVLGSWRLQAHAGEESRPILIALARLFPEDLLLKRDCQRFTTRPRPAPQPRKPSLRVIQKTTLGEGIEWSAAAATGNYLFAAGFQGNRLRCARYEWPRGLPSPSSAAMPSTWLNWPSPVATPAPLLLVPPLEGTGPTLLHIIGSAPLPIRYAGTTWNGDHLPNNTLPPPADVANHFRGGCFGWLPRHIAGAARSENVLWVHNYESGQPTLHGYGSDGTLLTTRHLTPPRLPADETQALVYPVPMYGRADSVFIAFGRHLAEYCRGQETIYTLPLPVQHLTAPSRLQITRLIATFEMGCALVSPHAAPSAQAYELFAHDMSYPIAGFCLSRWVIAANAEETQVYVFGTGGLRHHATGPGIGSPVLAILAPPRPNEFAILTTDGALWTYEIAE